MMIGALILVSILIQMPLTDPYIALMSTIDQALSCDLSRRLQLNEHSYHDSTFEAFI